MLDPRTTVIAAVAAIIGMGAAHAIDTVRINKVKTELTLTKAELDASRQRVVSREFQVAALESAIEGQNASIDALRAEMAREAAERGKWEEDARYWYSKYKRDLSETIIECDSIPVVDWREVLNAK